MTVPDRKKTTIKPIICENVETGSSVYTDEHRGYVWLNESEYRHAFVKHAEYYVDGVVHTNGIEKLLDAPEAVDQRHLRFH